MAGPALEAWGLRTVLLIVATGISLAAVLMTTIIKVDTGSKETVSDEEAVHGPDVLRVELSGTDLHAHGQDLTSEQAGATGDLG